jgi:DNA-directed RNA polymerase subunit beta'
VDRIERGFSQGALTKLERYNQLIDVWIHARELVTEEMMKELRADHRYDDGEYAKPGDKEAKPYLNPVFLMTESGARGSVDQIRQLAGMRALMAKPSGEIIETPIKSNFREGLSVLEYFSSTHGARKGLADTALKTADSGYLTRKLADVVQNVIINEDDCGTIQGVTKSAVYKGEEIDIPLRERIIGRTARDSIRNPVTDQAYRWGKRHRHARVRQGHRGARAGQDSRAQRPDLRKRVGGLCQVLRAGHVHRADGRGRPGRRDHRGPVDR